MSQLIIILLASWAFSQVPPSTQNKVESEVERINSMREGLVSGVRPPVSKDTFRAVCGPVGMSLKQVAEKEGWVVRQASHKYRNPKHKSNRWEQAAIEVFQKDPHKKDFWQETKKGSFYFRRIDIKTACLGCHGSKKNRPEFVKKGYPEDLAFDFKVGELRGIYSVFIKAQPGGLEKVQ